MVNKNNAQGNEQRIKYIGFFMGLKKISLMVTIHEINIK